MMLGDVGGLYDFLKLACAILVGVSSRNMMLAHMIQKLYREPIKERKILQKNALKKDFLSRIKPLKF